MYYLNSRYYDPQLGRFINADDISILSQSKDLSNGLNLYMYCNNNPIKYTDYTGRIPFASSVTITSLNRTIWELTDKYKFFGKISHSINFDFISQGDMGFFYSFTHSSVGSSNTTTTGVGINLWGWFGINASYYYGDEYGISLNVQITPWFHCGLSIGTDGLTLNLGINKDNMSYDLNINMGWGSVLVIAATYVSQALSQALYPLFSFFKKLFGLFA